MSAEEILRRNEKIATSNSQFISHVAGKKPITVKGGDRIKKYGATGMLLGVILVIAILFGSGNIIPSALMTRLREATDVQDANTKIDKQLVFQQALKGGEIAEDEVKILKQNNILVGYEEDGKFIETNSANRELSLKMETKIVDADSFMGEIWHNVELYDAIDEATYRNVLNYDDDLGEKVFEQVGVNKKDYSGDRSFNEVMEEKMGSGSNISVGNVSLKAEQENKDEAYEASAEVMSTKSKASDYIDTISEQTTSTTEEQATLDSATLLAVADTISKEQRSSSFYALLMEAINMMMAGDGRSDVINEMMNYLYTSAESEVVDVKTGEKVKIVGAPIEAPSLVAIMADGQIDADSVANYSSDRIIQLTENQIGTKANKGTILNTISSVSSSVKGLISRLLPSGDKTGDKAVLSLSEPIVDSSLENNSFQTLKGINAGEFLVEGAVNFGKLLAKQSGGSAGDETSILEYAKLNNKVLAMDAAAERLHKSPFDITSKNTFLGRIFYNLAMTFYSNRKLSEIVTSFSGIIPTTKQSIIGLLPGAYADNANGYLTHFGDCTKLGSINAKGSVICSENITFDTSTQNDPFNNSGFISFVENNTELDSSGKRVIKNDSVLANYIQYNNERITPLGVTDGGILESLSNDNSKSIKFVSNIIQLVKSFIGSSSEEKRIATGEAFVNSSTNPSWQVYKYAQRYVSLARTIAALRKFSNSPTAYNNILYFEGDENPVVAFLENYYQVANR
ncbi:hypothetical protein IKG49_01075 [Candidatus Saccharibacteria bacterium]|nr:hypothetical protein [Candidatus Saccharibacteria bacterium]